MLHFTHNKIKLKIMGIKINVMDTFFQLALSFCAVTIYQVGLSAMSLGTNLNRCM
jgi:hypothetical protein